MNSKKEQLDNLIKQYNKNNIIIHNQEKESIILEYNTNKLINKRILDNIHNLTEEIQNNCNHKVWYHLNSSTDDYEGRSYYTCKCLDCNKIEERRTRDFNYVIFTKEHFTTIQNKYEELKKTTNNIEILFKLLDEEFS